jgi:hypothetical protein
MPKTDLDETYAAELILRADDLQDEANLLAADLDLLVMLGRAGRAQRIGSSVTGLMVVRDLDAQVIAPGLSTDRALGAMRPLLARTQVLDARYTHERGRRYWYVLRYETDAGQLWTMDISFWLHEQHARADATEQIARRLDAEKRLAILWIKDVWRHLPTYPGEISGADITSAVLEHGVRTPDQFASYLLQQGKPVR